MTPEEPSDGVAPYGVETPPDAQPAVAIPQGTDGGLVWGPLHDAYMTWIAASRLAFHVKGAYQWGTAAGRPILVRSQEGHAVLAFAP